MRRVAGPNGVAWNVDVSWTDIRFGTKYKRKRDARARAQRESDEARARGDEPAPRGSWLEYVDFPEVDSVAGIVAGIIVVALVVVAVLAFPWLLVLLLDLVELLLFPLIAIGIIAWRVLRKRPFTITADRWEERVAEWNVIGLREARRVERAVADAVVAGGDPVELFPEFATHRYD
jgi:hypothetical protein